MHQCFNNKNDTFESMIPSTRALQEKDIVAEVITKVFSVTKLAKSFKKNPLKYSFLVADIFAKIIT